jgi:hypothetical protein
MSPPNFLGTDEVTQLAFSISENKGVYAVLLGSGMSRSAEIATGWEITLDLIRRTAAAKGIKDQADWGKWFQKTTGTQPDYSKVLEALAVTPAERRSILHSYIEPTEGDIEQGLKVPTKAHEAIADLVASGHIKVIVTTNFDRLMESALRSRGIEPTVVASVDALAGAEPLSHSTCYILKLHGDYKDARLLNTEDELGKYPPEFDHLLDRIFDEYGLIISGWSGEWDVALRKALSRAPNRRYPTYWTTRSDLKPSAQDLAALRAARVVKISDADAFFTELRTKVQTLEQARRVSPRSIDLTIAATKRFLGKPEHRIELEDLISSEAEKLLATISQSDFGTAKQPTPELFREQVAKYEAVTETFARVAGVMGRWGDGKELPLIIDVLKAIYSYSSQSAGGFQMWSSLRGYPGVLIFTAYALGLVRSQRWYELHKLFRSEIVRQYHDPQTLVDTYFASTWDGGDQRTWQWLPDFDRRHTPLSDHLLELFSDWNKGFIGLAPDFEALFSRFEILAALSTFEHDTLEKLEEAKRSRGSQQFAHVPYGRWIWHSASRGMIVQELKNAELQQVLFDAGFSRGSKRMLELFIETIGHAGGRIR